LAENTDKVKALKAAYPNERLGSDVRDNTNWNSYASRHYDAYGALIDDTVVLHEQYIAAHPSTSTEPTASAAPTNDSAVSSGPEDAPASSLDASVSPSTAPTSDVASPTPSDTPLPS
jgi:hypothetical protein